MRGVSHTVRAGERPAVPKTSLTSHDKSLAESVDSEPINKFSDSHGTQMFTARPIQSKFRVILKMQCYVTSPSASRSSKLLLPFMFASKNLLCMSYVPYVFPKYIN
jgi:hypothetical protein